MPDLRLAADSIKSQIGSGVTVVGSAPTADSANLFITVTKNLQNQIPADLVIKALAPLIDGKGGGKAGSAQAGGKQPGGLKKALGETEVRKAIEKAKGKRV